MHAAGSQNIYDWLISDACLSDLLYLVPEVVLGKYVAVTSIDSGALIPTEAETGMGWRSQGKIAYSPPIQDIRDLPRAGWDEWYVFDVPTDLGESRLTENIFENPLERGRVSVFVNYCQALHRADALTDMFWQQMDGIRPLTYVADNDYLNFATKDKVLFAKVRDAVKAPR